MIAQTSNEHLDALNARAQTIRHQAGELGNDQLPEHGTREGSYVALTRARQQHHDVFTLEQHAKLSDALACWCAPSDKIASVLTESVSPRRNPERCRSTAVEALGSATLSHRRLQAIVAREDAVGDFVHKRENLRVRERVYESAPQEPTI